MKLLTVFQDKLVECFENVLIISLVFYTKLWKSVVKYVRLIVTIFFSIKTKVRFKKENYPISLNSLKTFAGKL